MIKSIRKYLKAWYYKVLYSIAFYPVLLSILFLIIAVTTNRAESLEIVVKLKEKIPYLFISDYETSRAILNTLVAGILSLTVFSFSMVMVVLSQASSNFSPRVLPSLISNKKHQLILGFYIGTLLYCIFSLITLGAKGVDSDAIGLSTMLAAMFSVVCIVFFVDFIHSISTAIQINNIIDRIYVSSSKSLQKAYNSQHKKITLSVSETTNFKPLVIKKTGYYISFDMSLISTASKNKELQINVLPYLNQHLWEGDVIATVSKNLTDETMDELLFGFNLSTNRHSGDEGIGGMIKLMEIAVKAMSPGINDPGTAIEAVTKLGKLLYQSVAFANATSEAVVHTKWIVVSHNIAIEELLRIIIQPIRFYAKEDCTVLFQLIKALKYSMTNPKISEDNKASIVMELSILEADVKKYIVNEADRRKLLQQF
ncbi:DUF2254 domain-containing protein [Cellulophaga sp. E16_2]|uniref:DUF2254 domain-containing protein n=1 Tax=Cellulophaga sp. E16_2 TaxID=2789297 RepID=UPI001A936568|nr:DUF2254 family protein [Cellulophaga sp. E16_2]MBO0591570.1 DUF2254 domain-containing protein [Cellulophaga sp. E16_2]